MLQRHSNLLRSFQTFAPNETLTTLWSSAIRVGDISKQSLVFREALRLSVEFLTALPGESTIESS